MICPVSRKIQYIKKMRIITMANKNANQSKSFLAKRGQNTAEYMLLLLLIGGGSVLAFKTFGKGIINRFASVTNVIGGHNAINMNASDQVNAANATIDFGTFDKSADASTGGSGGTTTTP
jgi:hypothetical protein